MSAPWQNATYCFICKVGFGILTRRHHCRNCGVSVCDDCTASQKFKVRGYPEPQLVCKVCVAKSLPQPNEPAESPQSPVAYQNSSSSQAFMAVCGNCKLTIAGSSGLRTRCRCGCWVVFPTIVNRPEPTPLALPPGFELESWDCAACTYQNDAKSERCGMCSAPPPQLATWYCVLCTLENPSLKMSCEVCQAPRPPPQICFIMNRNQQVNGAQPTQAEREEQDFQRALSESKRELDELNEREAAATRAYEEALAQVMEASQHSEKRRLERERAELESKEAQLQEDREREQKEREEKEREKREQEEKPAFQDEDEEKAARAIAARERERQEEERLKKEEEKREERLKKEEEERLKREEEDRLDEERRRRVQEDLEKRSQELAALRLEQQRRLKELAAKSERESNDMLSQWRDEAGLNTQASQTPAKTPAVETIVPIPVATPLHASPPVSVQAAVQTPTETPAALETPAVAETSVVETPIDTPAGVPVEASAEAPVEVHVAEDRALVEQQERRQVLETLFLHAGENEEVLRGFMSQSGQFKRGEISPEQYADIICTTFPKHSHREVVSLLLRELASKNRELALSLKEALRTSLSKHTS